MLDFPAHVPLATTVSVKLLEILNTTAIKEVMRSKDYFVELSSKEAVQNIEPDFTMMKELNTGVIITAKGHTTDDSGEDSI